MCVFLGIFLQIRDAMLGDVQILQIHMCVCVCVCVCAQGTFLLVGADSNVVCSGCVFGTVCRC